MKFLFILIFGLTLSDGTKLESSHGPNIEGSIQPDSANVIVTRKPKFFPGGTYGTTVSTNSKSTCKFHKLIE